MHITSPGETSATKAVLVAECNKRGMTPERYRLGTLKRAECEISNILDRPLSEMHPDDRAALNDLRRQIQVAIAGE
ncbi:hypothetical protein [Thioalkalivibrio thiocyanodenitrificans]|uniref:hypothetical protein n=1 Tax=Thioalkalivibrio thiocyanodenitrificans TaxID=243063 RepID=UPI00037C6CE1|nr:hypothetical protein [Thioalkalivibrio thiocyanodenitrificans]